MTINVITDAGDIRSKTVLLRADFNVPLDDHGQIEDDFRIKATLPTIDYLREQGAKIIIISHIGREDESLKPVFEYLKGHYDLTFVENYLGDEAKEVVENLGEGEVLLFENLRLNAEEKANDEDFAKHLASLADIYVNDAFAVSHREHASIVGVPKFLPAFAGIQLSKEITELSKAFDPEHPFLFILGGAKFETKIPLMKKFVPIADSLYVGGAILNYVLKEQGKEVGTSLVPEEHYDISDVLESNKLIETVDVVVNDGNVDRNAKLGEITGVDKILDVGEATLEKIKEAIGQAQFIIWNGPMGYYEGGYEAPTKALSEAIAESDAHSVIGGGDTLAVIREQQNADKFTFVSTGGGAMLEFLANETLVGIEALK